jgi:hypothetical protein
MAASLSCPGTLAGGSAAPDLEGSGPNQFFGKQNAAKIYFVNHSIIPKMKSK